MHQCTIVTVTPLSLQADGVYRTAFLATQSVSLPASVPHERSRLECLLMCVCVVCVWVCVCGVSVGVWVCGCVVWVWVCLW